MGFIAAIVYDTAEMHHRIQCALSRGAVGPTCDIDSPAIGRAVMRIRDAGPHEAAHTPAAYALRDRRASQQKCSNESGQREEAPHRPKTNDFRHLLGRRHGRLSPNERLLSPGY